MFILELCVKKIGVLVFNLGDGFYILDFIKNGLTKPATILYIMDPVNRTV
jgi:hypothetical protein